jgi:hypothetical protein
LRVTEYLPYVILTAVSVLFVRAVTAERWSPAKKAVFTTVMAVLLFLGIGIYWLRTGEKPDETAIRLLLCPFFEDSDRCKRAATGQRVRPVEPGPPRIALPELPKHDTEQKPRTAVDCARVPTFSCLRSGSLAGSISMNLANMECAREMNLSSGDMRWQDIWTTSVYSYAPGGGGPGGGLENDSLRVGGWGDWYYALVQFDVKALTGPVKFAALLLNAKKDDGTPVAMHLDRIVQPWSWNAGDRLWWRDKPNAAPLGNIPRPEVERWYAIDITDTVEAWRAGRLPNFGLQLRPAANNNNYNTFYSSRAADRSKRPRLLVCA